MATDDFHEKPFDKATLTKLDIFELYTQEWLPVFLAKPNPFCQSLHVFDFFAGPGHDIAGNAGSPVRILNQFAIAARNRLGGWHKVKKYVHLFDGDAKKAGLLRQCVSNSQIEETGVIAETRCIQFEDAMREYWPVFSDPKAAKLLIIDQFGVDAVLKDVFLKLISFPVCDFMFFLSSSTLHRFRNHPAIKQKIEHPEDSYDVHRVAFEYYCGLIPPASKAYLAPFSIKRGSNIRGLIFGAQHPLGLHKFLKVAWENDKISGEANFDIDRDNIASSEMLLPLDDFKPKKLRKFEQELEDELRGKRIHNEEQLIRFCLAAGMTGQKAKDVMSRLRNQNIISCAFTVPNVSHINHPRPIRYP